MSRGGPAPRYPITLKRRLYTGARHQQFYLSSLHAPGIVFLSACDPFDPGCRHRGQVEDRDQVALARFPGLLAPEISLMWWPPRIDHEVRDLIRRMTKENPVWGAPQIHGERRMGIEIAQSTVGVAEMMI